MKTANIIMNIHTVKFAAFSWTSPPDLLHSNASHPTGLEIAETFFVLYAANIDKILTDPSTVYVNFTNCI